ncbi:MAG: hypothetical protein ACFNVK_12520, partial [Prevotella sp.]
MLDYAAKKPFSTCRLQNNQSLIGGDRCLYNLIFGTFGATGSKAKSGEEKEPKALSVEDAFLILEAANSVVFIPGYG